jgi:hypothetical protein
MGDVGSSRPGAVRSAGTKRAVIAVFVAATFGLMALLSVPSRFLPPALHIPAPIKQALNPFTPFIPPVGGGGKEPGGTVSQGLLGAGVRESLLGAPLRSGPIPPSPAPGEKGPVLPPRVPSIDHRRAASESEFLPEVGKENRSRRAIHRHRRAHRHHRRHCRRSHQQRQEEEVAQLRDLKTAAKPGHPPWRGEQGRRGGPVR